MDESTTGGNPESKFVKGPDGKLYTVMKTGGPNFLGGIVSLDPSNDNYSIEYALSGSGFEGYSPICDLYLDVNGLFYGTVSLGGPESIGSIFKYDPINQWYNLLYNFGNDENVGGTPLVGVTLYNGELYGATTNANTYGKGVIYKYSEGNPIEVLNKLNYYPTGSKPACILYQSEGTGMVYGSAASGGDFNGGVLYEINPLNEELRVLHHFGDDMDGRSPFHNMIVADNVLYGITSSGGNQGDGTLFSFDLTNEIYTKIWNFTDSYFGGPVCIVHADSLCYITTENSINKHVYGSNSVDMLHIFDASEDFRHYGNFEVYNGVIHGATTGARTYSFDPSSSTFTWILDQSSCGIFCVKTASGLKRYGNKLYGLLKSVTPSDNLLYSYNLVTGDHIEEHQFPSLWGALSSDVFQGEDDNFYLMTRDYNSNASSILRIDLNQSVLSNVYSFPVNAGSSIWVGNFTKVSHCPFENVDVQIEAQNNTLECLNSYDSYQWFVCGDDNIIIDGETSSNFTATSTGMYGVQVELNGCTFESECELIAFADTPEQQNSSFDMYPNPATDEVNLILPINSSIEILNAIGENVIEAQFIEGKLINVEFLPRGIYFVRVKHSDSQLTKKLILK